MIYITQMIYVIEGKEEVFNEFEAIAIPTLSKYNGRLLFRIRPDRSSFNEKRLEEPYEIHWVEFATENDFTNFMRDGDRKQFLHLKEQSVKSVLLIKGTVL